VVRYANVFSVSKLLDCRAKISITSSHLNIIKRRLAFKRRLERHINDNLTLKFQALAEKI